MRKASLGYQRTWTTARISVASLWQRPILTTLTSAWREKRNFDKSSKPSAACQSRIAWYLNFTSWRVFSKAEVGKILQIPPDQVPKIAGRARATLREDANAMRHHRMDTRKRAS